MFDIIKRKVTEGVMYVKENWRDILNHIWKNLPWILLGAFLNSMKMKRKKKTYAVKYKMSHDGVMQRAHVIEITTKNDKVIDFDIRNVD